MHIPTDHKCKYRRMNLPHSALHLSLSQPNFHVNKLPLILVKALLFPIHYLLRTTPITQDTSKHATNTLWPFMMTDGYDIDLLRMSPFQFHIINTEVFNYKTKRYCLFLNDPSNYNYQPNGVTVNRSSIENLWAQCAWNSALLLLLYVCYGYGCGHQNKIIYNIFTLTEWLATKSIYMILMTVHARAQYQCSSRHIKKMQRNNTEIVNI